MIFVHLLVLLVLVKLNVLLVFIMDSIEQDLLLVYVNLVILKMNIIIVKLV